MSRSCCELNHLRGALALSVSQRWDWLRQAVDLGFATARDRARRGLITLRPHGEVLWSPERERAWQAAQLSVGDTQA